MAQGPTVRLQTWDATGKEPRGVGVHAYDQINRDAHADA